MRQFIIPTKDTTLYQAYPSNNAGLDEILEIGKVLGVATSSVTVSSSISASITTEFRSVTQLLPSYASASARSVLYFELPASGSVTASADYYLNLRLANVKNVRRGQELKISIVSSSWDEGSGYFYQDRRNANDGATWNNDVSGSAWVVAGGDYLSTPTASITLTQYPLQDLRIDVTSLIRPLVNSGSTFHGLAVHFPPADESNAENEGNIKVFSSQTHTIHQPSLEVAWDDQIFVTGSLVTTPTSLDVKIVPSNLKEQYVQGEYARINFVVRDPYPLRSFDSTLRYAAKYYLPSASQYSIKDVQSNTTVIPFDAYSKMSCDATGVYFDLDTAGLYKGRFYNLSLKILLGGYSRYIHGEWMFQVV